jgi:hypothetical protein
MLNLTEREEQEMIERAKGGDPKANYDMSLWALEQAVAEPEEERWNRLAAKCLVKAAEAGYEPAKERMNQLLAALQASDVSAPAAQPLETDESQPEADQEFDWSGEPDQRPQAEHAPQEQPNFALRAVAMGGMAAKAVGSGAKTLWTKGKALVESYSAKNAEKSAPLSEDEDVLEGDAPTNAPTAAPASAGAKHASNKKFALPDFSSWDDAKWKKMQVVCVVVCVVLAVLIAIMVVSGKKDKTEEDTSQVPPAATTAPATPTPTIEPVLYPDATVRAEIQSATSLDVYPEDSEYVTEETTATVTPGAGLNLRRGPGSGYSQIVLMSYNSQLEVYAYKNGWALVKYDGSTWGWCSDDYIKLQ